ncbi:hypothetical protein C6I20_09230 [Aeromicrobium sp. A1-2]|uniref:TasA family protein n=1 Tax=Aeromicrobium sp. A1-2 TaxID=2107713 RepID=UPI000E543A5B|nr:TasA family protein [Aeromicrobium sp. A1-2]AXT85353.1 hypothetical protein C6I20_09230 [Aeromicrobium sp. A1-2]
MSSHRDGPNRAGRKLLGSVRARALLSLGVALGIGATGTFAYWTDDVVISGSTFTAGTLDLKVNNADAYATTTLSMTAMVPGNTSAEVLTVKNGGTAALKYSISGVLSGTDVAVYSTNSALRLTVTLGGTKSGTGSASTCTAGTATLVNAVALTSTTTILIPSRGPLAGSPTSAAELLCFQVSFDAAAPTGLQGKAVSATFTATGTSDLS